MSLVDEFSRLLDTGNENIDGFTAPAIATSAPEVDAPEPKPSFFGRNWMWILLGVLLLTGVIVLLYFMWWRPKAPCPDEGATPENLADVAFPEGQPPPVNQKQRSQISKLPNASTPVRETPIQPVSTAQYPIGQVAPKISETETPIAPYGRTSSEPRNVQGENALRRETISTVAEGTRDSKEQDMPPPELKVTSSDASDPNFVAIDE